MSSSVIILGGGGHAKVLLDILLMRSFAIIGITDPNIQLHGQKIRGVPIIGSDDTVMEYSPDFVRLVNGIGSVGSTEKRRRIFDQFKQKGYTFATIVHPSSVIASDVIISEGTQIMAGVIIQTGSFIGPNTIINTKTSVDHDCIIGAHCHLAPGVTLSGHVSIGDGTHIGTGTSIIHSITIGSNCLIGAGSLIVKNIGDSIKVRSIPSKEV